MGCVLSVCGGGFSQVDKDAHQPRTIREGTAHRSAMQPPPVMDMDAFKRGSVTLGNTDDDSGSEQSDSHDRPDIVPLNTRKSLPLHVGGADSLGHQGAEPGSVAQEEICDDCLARTCRERGIVSLPVPRGTTAGGGPADATAWQRASVHGQTSWEYVGPDVRERVDSLVRRGGGGSAETEPSSDDETGGKREFDEGDTSMDGRLEDGVEWFVARVVDAASTSMEVRALVEDKADIGRSSPTTVTQTLRTLA